MQPYANRGGASGVVAFKIGDDRIEVWLKSRPGYPYTYTYENAGEANVEAMKILARHGEGLLVFTNKNVRDVYGLL